MAEPREDYNRRKRKDNAAKRERDKKALKCIGCSTRAEFNAQVAEYEENGAIIAVFKLIAPCGVRYSEHNPKCPLCTGKANKGEE